MHYSNGRAAKLGDLVRGKGYNIKHEIVGKLIHATPEASSCNCTVATVTYDSYVLGQMASDMSNPNWTRTYQVVASHEYGQLDQFVAIDPRTGEVLPPE